jgi:hypothetical protein
MSINISFGVGVGGQLARIVAITCCDCYRFVCGTGITRSGRGIAPAGGFFSQVE